jgi:hypothetical protein
MSRLFSLLLLVPVLTAVVFADVSDDNKVVKLNKDGFQKAVDESSHFVMFFAPW